MSISKGCQYGRRFRLPLEEATDSVVLRWRGVVAGASPAARKDFSRRGDRPYI
jgi:hypothetical protein